VYREADWWGDVTIAVGGRGTLKFTCTPAQHMTARTTWDQAKSLWGGWAVEEITSGDERGAKVWFAGDTGYAAVESETHEIDPNVPTCPAFKEIGDKFGGFDLAFIPIGAYAPRRFLSTVHCAPIDSVRVFKDVVSCPAPA
jgi:N-acyl-phosphatidylethanolamine-hydrolysing phospholipase D